MEWLIIVLYFCTVILKITLNIAAELYEKHSPMWYKIATVVITSIIPLAMELIAIVLAARIITRRISVHRGRGG